MSGTRLGLASHPTARDKALANSNIAQGSTIISVDALVTVLNSYEKGQRCDTCHRRSTDLDEPLRKCTRCASYWYCDAECQNLQWKAHHKKICKRVNQFTTSLAYQSLAEHERLDAFLLSHLLANVVEVPDSSAFSTFRTLLPGPVSNIKAPPVCVAGENLNSSSSFPAVDTDAVYARFGNNNFAIHSHLTTFGHGVFPLASRMFNHSCVPNAAPKYVLERNRVPRMEVVALRDIAKGEEICVPYLDPALVQSRKQIFELTYGFTCRCQSCLFIERVNACRSSDDESDVQQTGELTTFEKELTRKLREFAFPDGVRDPSSLASTIPFDSIPAGLFPAIRESYLTKLSAAFANASHDGPYDVAVEVGVAMLGLYRMIYPQNYPQIGMHLLELAKVLWNSYITAPAPEPSLLRQTSLYLSGASRILSVYGNEGDDGGPLEEVKSLDVLLTSEP